MCAFDFLLGYVHPVHADFHFVYMYTVPVSSGKVASVMPVS